MSLYLDTDPLSGAVSTFDYDENEQTAIIRRVCDVTAIIDNNKELANHTDGWIGEGRDMRHAASVPIDVAYLWLEKYGVRAWRKEDWPFVRKLLNSNEWRYLRVQEFML